jgi:hypothetical protein
MLEDLLLDNVKVEVSKIHKGKIAPNGKVFYISKMVYSKRKWENAILIDRKDMLKEMELPFINAIKQNFIKSIQKQLA